MNTSTPALLAIGAAAVLALSGCGTQNTDQPKEHGSAMGSAEAGDLTVEGAWLAEPAQPSMTAGYLTITNSGDGDVSLTEAETSLSDRTELHTVETTESGASQMTPVDTIPVPAGETVELASGGLHIMVLEMERPPEVGDTATITLTFDNGETVEVEAPVRERAGSGGHRPGDEQP
ncbi:copper chaperone PCu(A)C [Thermobifida halotolerans]|uniref:Copper chaperone PCu(A)C n=1 Tax=Thermobifida halotolerans TaxID=483545 RepID=A0A399FYG3_9ACTN|nr:copper chaperone PCu(A)C [Thermobifida halotolerans]UOE18945.1 copper chaperone PCu(A)C [Thermobifida halotolerans]